MEDITIEVRTEEDRAKIKHMVDFISYVTHKKHICNIMFIEKNTFKIMDFIKDGDPIPISKIEFKRCGVYHFIHITSDVLVDPYTILTYSTDFYFELLDYIKSKFSIAENKEEP